MLTLEGPLVFVSDYPLSDLVPFFVHFELGKLSKLLSAITALEGLLQFQFFPMHLSHVLLQLELVLADVKTFGTRDLIDTLIRLFFGRFSAIKTKSTWQNLEFWGEEKLEFFEEFA